MIWWGGVLITSFARAQITIATSSAYGTCACASEAVYVKELLKFIGEETHVHLELDESNWPREGKTHYSQILVVATTCRREDHQANECQGNAAPSRRRF
eukprot:5311395-Amphidinium_carterae.1